jgi:hypothetical protein
LEAAPVAVSRRRQQRPRERGADPPGTDHVLFAESGDDAGEFQRIFLAEVDGDRVRVIDDVEVDEAGVIYVVAAFDPEGTVEDPDDGPFRGAAFEIGRVVGGTVELHPEPTLLATVDGFKLESIASRDVDGGIELFVGTDDENYGGTLRPLPPQP